MEEKSSEFKIIELQMKAKLYPSGSVSIDGIRHGPSTNIARFIRQMVENKMIEERIARGISCIKV